MGDGNFCEATDDDDDDDGDSNGVVFSFNGPTEPIARNGCRKEWKVRANDRCVSAMDALYAPSRTITLVVGWTETQSPLEISNRPIHMKSSAG